MHVLSSYMPDDYDMSPSNTFVEQSAETFMLAIRYNKNCYKSDRMLTTCLFCKDASSITIARSWQKRIECATETRYTRQCASTGRESRC
jgi:hypothetical protein